MENKYSNKYVLETGIGLQDVDHLKNSSYFIQESKKYLRGEISLDELDNIVSSYYANKHSNENRSEEADKISIRIARLISEDSFVFTVGQLLTIHKSHIEVSSPNPYNLHRLQMRHLKPILF